MSYQFYVIMQKRRSGEVYADIHKTNEKIYFSQEEAEKDLLNDKNYDEIRDSFHVVPLVATTVTEYDDIIRVGRYESDIAEQAIHDMKKANAKLDSILKAIGSLPRYTSDGQRSYIGVYINYYDLMEAIGK
jgi:hypothetical protein